LRGDKKGGRQSASPPRVHDEWKRREKLQKKRGCFSYEITVATEMKRKKGEKKRQGFPSFSFRG